jgi:predicted secreted protein
MATYPGSNFLLQKETAHGGGVYATIAGFQANQLSINNAPVDVTAKGNIPWQLLKEYGIRKVTISGSGIWSNDTYARACLTDIMTAGQAIRNFKLISDDGLVMSGNFFIMQFSLDGAHNDAVKFNISLDSSGTITYTAPSA